ncbi:MAG: DUF5916 domain-containing protein [Acidobacteriota bacterium]|nr:DUF5916 domain-containing protein [Acidobacteriota bacterium]
MSFQQLFLCLCFLFVSSAAAAQSIEILGPPAPVAPAVFAKDDQGRITLRATRLEAPLALDGALDEAVYREVTAIDHFVQQEPDEGRAGTEKTLVWLFFDDDHFYVSVRSFDSAPERLVANELRRDNFNIYNNDNISISIDPLYTRRSGVFFQTNALSAQRDQEIQDERSNNNDWNTIWRTRSRILPDGWSMEFAVPYSSLRFRAAGPQVWGFNLRRVIRWKNEHVSIAPIPASATTRAMYKFDIMATVVGVETPSVRKPIDVKPYAIAASTTNLAATPVYRNDPSADAGVDVKYSLTNSLVADLTYRTDFAQVEEDQQQVNLTRFSLFFPEKRDFFLEGQGLFTFGGSQGGRGGGGLTPIVFYSRRIGLGATGEIPIIGGGRVAGRAGKYSIGLLSIQTEDTGIGNRESGVGRGASYVPSTNFSVIRLRRDVLRRSNIGAIFTRKTPIDGITNTVLGVDANFWFHQNVTMTGYFAQSETEAPAKAGGYIDDGPAKAGRHIDRSSYRGEFEWAPDRYGLRYEHLVVGRDFQPEIGFLRRTAFRRNFASARFSPRPGGSRAIRRHVFEGEFDYITGTDGVLESRQAQVSYDAELRGNDQWSIEYSNNYEHLRVGFNVVPGKPIPAGTYRFNDVRTTYEFGPQRRASGSVFGGTGTFYDGTKTELGARGVVEISSRFNVEPGVTVNWIDIPAGAFTTAVTSVRTTYMFSPYMALGGLVQHNSTSKTLGSSVRLRWEYAPGSDLFVVYSDGRDTRLGDRFPGLQNRTFVVKATRLFRF